MPATDPESTAKWSLVERLRALQVEARQLRRTVTMAIVVVVLGNGSAAVRILFALRVHHRPSVGFPAFVVIVLTMPALFMGSRASRRLRAVRVSMSNVAQAVLSRI